MDSCIGSNPLNDEEQCYLRALSRGVDTLGITHAIPTDHAKIPKAFKDLVNEN